MTHAYLDRACMSGYTGQMIGQWPSDVQGFPVHRMMPGSLFVTDGSITLRDLDILSIERYRRPDRHGVVSIMPLRVSSHDALPRPMMPGL